MQLEDITCLRPPVAVPTEAEIDQLEIFAGCRVPAGYREYLTLFGEGILGGTFVRIYPPWRIIEELAGWRDRIEAYWSWESGDAGDRVQAGLPALTHRRAIDCMIVGDTLNGDEMIVHPDAPDVIYVLPRDSRQIHVAGPTLLEAIEWVCSSGTLTTPFPQRNFEPSDSR